MEKTNILNYIQNELDGHIDFEDKKDIIIEVIKDLMCDYDIKITKYI